MFLVLALLFVKMGLNLLGVIDFLGLSWFRMGGFIELSIRYILLFPTNKSAAAPTGGSRVFNLSAIGNTPSHTVRTWKLCLRWRKIYPLPR